MCNKANGKKEIFVFFFQILQIFFYQVCLYSQELIFFKKTRSFVYIICKNLHEQKSHFQVFIFDLNSSRDLAFLYSDWRFAQRNGTRYVTVSIPYFTIFLFSVKTSWKFLILWMLARKLKSASLLVVLYRLQFHRLQSWGLF